ncbi:MAG: glycosyltransferase family 4 protein, partial [Moorea sp. SIO3G5]|nr:glycosyltransferase family 4 protein [Moorena sp. SIO3G5]
EVEQACQLVESLDLGDYIKVPGGIDSGQRDALLAKADIFILPSYNEGLPMAMLEAMGWGLPVITTPVGGIPELVVHGDNGLLVKPGEIPELSMAMQTLINDQALRLSLGRKARASVAHLNIEDYCSSLLNIYCSVLESKRVAL